ncbi:MAG: hypothetical protein JWL77_2462 [Chthonomonadaceae bacterium]|nr:hypothetical protein [Chthonomonadaceae bacterium]
MVEALLAVVVVPVEVVPVELVDELDGQLGCVVDVPDVEAPEVVVPEVVVPDVVDAMEDRVPDVRRTEDLCAWALPASRQKTPPAASSDRVRVLMRWCMVVPLS